MFHIKSVLYRTAQNLGKVSNIDDKMVFQESKKIIQKSAPDAEVLFYKNRILGIKCVNSIIANELFLNQESLKEKINSFLNKKVIKRIIIKT